MVDQTGAQKYAMSGGEGLGRALFVPAVAGLIAIALAFSFTIPTAQLVGFAAGGAFLWASL